MTQDNRVNDSDIKWKDIQNDGSLETFSNLNNLEFQSLQMQEYGVIILPKNTIFPKQSESYNLFPESAKEILDKLKSSGIRIRLYEDNREKRALLLKHADVIILTLLFFGKAIASLSLSILAKWIYDRWVATKPKQMPIIKTEYIEINSKGTLLRWRKIEGPANKIQPIILKESQMLMKKNPYDKK